MSKHIEIIVTKEDKTIGTFGQKRRVRLGYARNYLFPKGYAIRNTNENLKTFVILEKKELKRKTKEKENAVAIQTQLKDKTITIISKARKSGKLYGSVSSIQILATIKKEFDISLDKKTIQLPNSIKEIGKHSIVIQLHPEVDYTLPLTITATTEESDK